MGVADVRGNVLRGLRQRIGPSLNRVAQTVGQPTTHVYPPGYVGTVPRSIAEIEAELEASEFRWDPLSMYHYTLEGNETNGSWAYRSSLFADRQLHAVLFEERSGATEIYAHDEYNWSRHPIKHAREVDIRRHEGAAEMRRWLEEREIVYERDSQTARTVKHRVQQLCERLDSGLVRKLTGPRGIR